MPDHEEAPIEIADYDPTWPDRFEIERQALAVVLEPWLSGSIEHFGSTAVVGLKAKPVIDIMAAFRDYLRKHAEVAADYSAVKSQLAVAFPHDREGYTQAKGPFIERVLAMAQCG